LLILTRRQGQIIVINNDIKIYYLGHHCNQGRIGIEAPKNITIHREEIQQRIELEAKYYNWHPNVEHE
jgi:carbon storage regulator